MELKPINGNIIGINVKKAFYGAGAIRPNIQIKPYQSTIVAER